MHRPALVTALALLLSTPALATDPAGLPPKSKAPKHEVTNTYWGVTVPDGYQYMENLKDPIASRWAKGQDRYTRAWLDSHPERKAILDRVVALTHSESPDYYGGSYDNGTYFFLKEQPPKEQPFLIAMTSVMDVKTERTIVDPNALDSSGGLSIDFYAPSRDGRYVAVSLSKNGTEDGTLHLYQAASGTPLPDVIPGVNGGTAGGSAAWNADESGLYYTRYPHGGERPPEDLPFYQQIYFHKLGTPISEDTYVLGKEFPKIAEVLLSTSRDGRYVLADVSNGDGGEHGYWLLSPGGAWTQFARFEDKIIEATFGLDNALYLISREDAPRKKILRLPLEFPDLHHAAVIVPQGDNAIEFCTPTESRLYVTEMAGGPTQMRVYDLHGRELGLVTMPEISLLNGAVRTSGDEVLVRSQSYTRPPAYYKYGPGRETMQVTALAQTSPADFSDCEVRREFADAFDGTKLPVNIILRKGTKLDGQAPAILYGYGSYGLSEQPYFQPDLKLWLEQGGIYVDASIRGGGEYGDAWHDAARLGTKRISMDDFAACARYLVEKGYTSKEKLAIEGGSAGGLLVYGTLVHYPDFMQAAVAHVGYGDVLRTERSPNGEFNTTEFGTVKDSVQFRGMYGYSPYHHVQDKKTYPSVLALTGMNDPRVPAWETFKMVARLQATGSKNPVLMRVSYEAGHGIQTALSERDEQTADVMMFLFDRLGVKYRPVPRDGKAGKPVPSP
ncbi:MAG TPA: prolyl oligopeptidase family serine peptidase [Candidatus Binatia bacterium]|nr:prolyl oligopeptidase family serine peptidase [Candidatus Binatia bacterium]